MVVAGCGQECAGASCADPDAVRDAGADDASTDGSAPGPCTFCNEAERAGFTVDGPAYGRGAAWVDVDGDGWEDLWQCDTGTGYPDHPRRSMLYRNRGDAVFEAEDLDVPWTLMVANWSGTWADYDSDGDPDLFLVSGGYSQPSRIALLRNDLLTNGEMTDVSEAAGIRTDPQKWWGAAFADFDRDGHLDLAVTAIDGPVVVYHSLGDGTFDDVETDLGIAIGQGDAKNPLWFDYDVDGDPDLYVAGVTEHHLWRNDGAGGFTDVTESVFTPLDVGIPVFAAAAADFDQDGREDLFLGRWDLEDYILLNRGAGDFERVGADVGLDMRDFPVTDENTMGLTVGDVTGDGWPEVFIGTGRPEERGNPILYCHEGEPLRFRRCSDDVVAGQGLSRNHAIALADPDHDGDTDFFWSLGGHVEYDLETGADSRQLAAFYVNRAPHTPGAVVRLVGTASNRDAIGAHLVVRGTETRHYFVHGAQGFPAQSSEWLPATLGEAATGTVTVTWPNGAVSEHEVADGDRVELVEPPAS